MEHLRLQADRFQKQGRLQEDEMKMIINEMRREMAGNKEGEQIHGSAKAKEHARVMEAVEEGLLQVHGIAPNSKQEASSGFCARMLTASTIGSAGTRRLRRH
jgi:hypothetical protein